MRSVEELTADMRAFQESRVLLTALELDAFTAVGDGATADQAAARTGCDARALAMLLNALVALGAMQKEGALYRTTPVTAGWLCGPQSARLGLLHIAGLWRTWSTLTNAVRTGTAVRAPGVEKADEEWTRAFIAAMHQRAARDSGELVEAVGRTGACRLLDVGGGSGAYSIALAQANPDLTAIVLDQPHVTGLARDYIAVAGLSARIATQDGDLRADHFGQGFDVVLVSAICHMLGEEENRDLLIRCGRALKPGGRIVVRDFILDEDRTFPPQAVLFSLNMLVGTSGGASYTQAEYDAWLRAAGCGEVVRPKPQGDVLIGMMG